MNLVAYTRVSTKEQEANNSLEGQSGGIANWGALHGHTIMEVPPEIASGKTRERRPSLQIAMDMCRSGQADGIVVARLDRLTRSLRDFVEIVEASRQEGWGLYILDLGIDLNTPVGDAIVKILAVFAELTRHIIVENIKTGLSVARTNGKKCGRTSQLDPKLIANIVTMHTSGLGYSAIAQKLNDAGVPTGQGGKQWYPRTIMKLIATHGAKVVAA